MSDDLVRLAPESLRDLERLSDAYKGGDKVLQKRLRDGLKAAGKPLGTTVVRQGGAGLPRRGGLRDRALGAKVLVTASLGAKKAKVTIRMGSKAQHASLKGFDEGTLRHPVFGNRKVWVSQPSGTAGAYSRAFLREQGETADRLAAEVAKGLDEIARKA